MTAPPSSEELDDKLRSFLRSAYRARWAVIWAAATISILAVAVLGWLVYRDQQRLEASCSFYRDVATAPLAVSPPASRKPSQLGVSIVLHARFTYQGQGCPDELPPAGAGLKKWASYYHLPRPPA